MGVEIESTGNFSNTEKFLKFIARGGQYANIAPAAQRGVEALRSATPAATGLTAASWSYEMSQSPGQVKIGWANSNVHNGFHVASAIQYGHGTGTGGYVPGQDYINPAMRPVFDEIANDVWKAVTSA